MNDMSAMLLIPILTITVVLSLSVSNVYALTTVKNTDFSIDIQDNWAFDLIQYALEFNITNKIFPAIYFTH